MLALLNEPQGLSLAPEHFHVEFHESGRAACFWIDVHSDADIERLSPQARMDALVTRTLQPVVEAAGSDGAKSIANLSGAIPGYLINWYLGENARAAGLMSGLPRYVSTVFLKNNSPIARITRCGER
ncbi:Ferric reductase [Klebsiella pneumoniae]|uniref:Ferric reductase n=1 Tax=Klebsiella pneumoniae TaxID=573 RepID=A0A377WCC6_KLEPN|nr:Ferric reductase [Klebsiella pneumoniae]